MKGLIHVGASDGSEYIGSRQPLILFEPQADAFRRLEDNFKDAENVTLVNLALGARPASAWMYVSMPDHSSSLLPPKKHLGLYPEIEFYGREAVQVSTLDREMKGRKGFDTLVIDAQGYELQVLEGARKTLRDITRIKCEVNFDQVWEGCALVGQVDAFLAPFMFRRTKTITHPRGMYGDAYYKRR